MSIYLDIQATNLRNNRMFGKTLDSTLSYSIHFNPIHWQNGTIIIQL